MVDFRMMMKPEERAEFDRRRAHIKEKLAEFAEKSTRDFLIDVLHGFHNSSCTGYRGVNGLHAGDLVYDATLVYLMLPCLIEKLAIRDPDSADLAKAIEKSQNDRKSIKCPMQGCTGYIDLWP